MTSVAEVRLWGNTIGAVSIEDHEKVAAFEYDADFANNSGIEVAPLKMPLSNNVYRFIENQGEAFHGLPGLLADSLPDRFGNAVIDAWLERQGRPADSFNAVERLCYIGDRGMGALEYLPSIGPGKSTPNALQIDQLAELSSEIVSQREALNLSFDDGGKEEAMANLLQVGISAGGARAKAVIAWNPSTNEVRSGQIKTAEGFEYWVLKFDGIGSVEDRALAMPSGYGVIEYAYSLMAKDAGINMSECRLFEENDRRHFMTKRFDRLPNDEKLHMQSLSALAHYDYNMAGVWSYEQSLMVLRQLDLSMQDIEQQFRRMVFNIVARNQDDHVKNIGFMMDKSGSWSLSPAFDLSYSYVPGNKWMDTHQLSMNGKRDEFVLEDFKACAKTISMKRGVAEKIIEEVIDVVSKWQDYADKVGVDAARRDKIQQVLRINGF